MTRPTMDREALALLVPKFDAYGGKLCWWPPCQNRLKGRKQKWCSPECADNAWCSYNFVGARGRVFQRDHGICAICGLDMLALRDGLEWWEEFVRRHENQIRRWFGNRDLTGAWRLSEFAVRELMNALGIARNKSRWDDLWDADHIIPLAEGGKLCDLSNLRTLCWRCHRAETAALASRLAKAKRVAAKHKFGYVPLKFQGGIEV